MAFTGNMHKLGQAGTGSNEDSFIAMFLHEFRNGENFADDHVRIKFDAQFLQFFNLGSHDGFWQTEFRNAVAQYTARYVERFKDSYVKSFAGKFTGAGKTRRAGADDRGFMTILGIHTDDIGCMFSGPVSYETFQATDGNRFILDAADAFAFALCFLRADAARDAGQGVSRRDDVKGTAEIAFSDFGNELGIGIPTGQPVTHNGFLHCRQRFASLMACSSV